MNDEELSALIRRRATRHQASEQLQASVRTQIMLADAGRNAATPTPLAQPRSGRSIGWRSALAGFASGVMVTTLVVVVVVLAGPLWRGLGGPEIRQNELVAELVADHVHALQTGPLTEVASTDRHTVKPWFQGKLDYAPPVFDLAADGFPLLGGRVEKVRGSAVAALAYTHNRHVINLFVWPLDSPASSQPAPQRQIHRGFTVAHWADGAMQYWLVSDTDRAELDRFMQAWSQRQAAP